MPATPSIPSTRQLVCDLFKSNPDLRRDVVATGRCDSSSHAASSGPLRPSAQLTRDGVEVQLPTAAAWLAECAWHAYCDKHGYPSGKLLGADKAPGNAYPPRPAREIASVVLVKWPDVARFLREQDNGTEPLELQSSRPAPAAPAHDLNLFGERVDRPEPAPGEQLGIFDVAPISTFTVPAPAPLPADRCLF